MPRLLRVTQALLDALATLGEGPHDVLPEQLIQRDRENDEVQRRHDDPEEVDLESRRRRFRRECRRALGSAGDREQFHPEPSAT